MLVGICELFIYLPDCQSLKEKRSIIKRLKALLRKKYNISISEIGQKNIWKKCTIGICCIGDNRQIIDKIIDRVMKDIESNAKIELVNIQTSIS